MRLRHHGHGQADEVPGLAFHLREMAIPEAQREDARPFRPVGGMCFLVAQKIRVARFRPQVFGQHVDAVEQNPVQVLRIGPGFPGADRQPVRGGAVALDFRDEERKNPALDVVRVLGDGDIEEFLGLGCFASHREAQESLEREPGPFGGRFLLPRVQEFDRGVVQRRGLLPRERIAADDLPERDADRVVPGPRAQGPESPQIKGAGVIPAAAERLLDVGRLPLDRLAVRRKAFGRLLLIPKQLPESLAFRRPVALHLVLDRGREDEHFDHRDVLGLSLRKLVRTPERLEPIVEILTLLRSHPGDRFSQKDVVARQDRLDLIGGKARQFFRGQEPVAFGHPQALLVLSGRERCEDREEPQGQPAPSHDVWEDLKIVEPKGAVPAQTAK